MNTKTSAAIAAYLAAIVAANLLVAAYGPSVIIANAFLLIGLDLALRDYLHDAWSDQYRAVNMLALVAAGGAISYALNAGAGRIAVASTAAFALAAVADWTVYGLAHRWPWLARSNASNIVGAAVDSLAFPTIAFGGVLWPIVAGQFVAKTLGGAAWSTLIYGMRRARAAAHHGIA